MSIVKKTLGIAGLVAFGGLAFNLGKQSQLSKTNKSIKTRRAEENHNPEDYIFDSLVDAQEVLVKLNEVSEKYDFVTVADYYDLIGAVPNYKDHNYGWNEKSIKKAKITRIYRGYVVALPPVEVI